MPPKRGRGQDEDQHASSSSSSGGRSALNQVDQRLVTDSITAVLEVLDELAKRVKNNKEDAPAEVVNAWKQQIVEVAKEAARVLKLDESFDRNASKILQEKFRDMGDAENMETTGLNIEGIKGIVESLVKEDMKSFKAEDIAEVRKIVDTCTKKVDEEDEDFGFHDTEIREADLVCPYTRVQLVHPMKNINPTKSCIHHISPEALDVITKNKGNQGAVCPVPGCVGKWLKTHAVEDEDHKRKIDRFLRKKQARTEASKFTQSAVDLD